MHHTSGIRGYIDLVSLRGEFNPRVFDNLSMKNVFHLVSRQKKPVAEAGEQYEYCNTGYLLLAALVERTSGLTLNEFAKRHIFTPLGMNSAFFIQNPSQVIQGYATAYQKRDNEFEIHTTRSAIVGSTGLVCRAEDLIKWDRCFEDCQLGSGETDLMGRLQETGKLADGSPITYAGGLNVEEHRGLQTVHHAGSLFGHGAMFLRFPSEHLTIIVLSNYGGLDASGLSYQIADVILSEHLGHEPPEEQTTEGNCPDKIESMEMDVNPFLGLYRSRKTRSAMTIKGDASRIQLNLFGFQGEPHTYLPVTESEFVLTERGVSDLNPPQRVRFRSDRNGLAIDIYYGEEVTTTYDRVRTSWHDFQKQENLDGSYYSEDLDVIYRVVHEDGMLRIRTMDGHEVSYLQVADDEFTSNLQFIDVRRDNSGEPIGFSVLGGPTQKIGIEFMRISIDSSDP